MNEIFRTICAILAFLLLFGLAGTMDVQEEERQAEQYCEMVAMYKETNGQQGWPAYDGEEVCRNTQPRLAQSGGDAGAQGEQQ